jgi:urea transport system substrate-binding protein
LGFPQSKQAIRVGILHSLSGTMAVSEGALKDSLLMFVAEQNQRGGLLGRPLEAVIVDPASNWPLYAEKARQLIEREKVAVIFGCWTSASRRAVKPVIEELNSLLFYPIQYEGREQSPNNFYLGAAPNQQAVPAVQYFKEELSIERWVLAGTDYIYPRTTNRILASYLENLGVDPDDIMLSYTPFAHKDWQRIVKAINQFASTGRKTAVISTITGDANIAFYRELARQRRGANTLPVLAFSVGEEEIKSIGIKPMVGHYAAWNYFMSIDAEENRHFVANWQAFTGDDSRVSNDPMEAQYIGFRMWVSAVERAGTIATDKVRDAMIGITAANLTGSSAQMLPNHHINKPVYIGKVKSDGQYQIIWRSPDNINGGPWYGETWRSSW